MSDEVGWAGRVEKSSYVSSARPKDENGSSDGMFSSLMGGLFASAVVDRAVLCRVVFAANFVTY